MECLVGNSLDGDEGNLNNRNISSSISELPFSPFLAKLFLQENNSLTMISPSFFQHMPVLQVLDLSHTSIQHLPPSISRLHLLEKLILQECSLLMEVPLEVGALKNLKLFDLQGTELMYLPKQIGKLETLERLRVSLSACADDQKDRYGIQYIIPRMMISKLSKLKELSISVDPEAEWWEVELLEAIMEDLPFLPEIKTLNLYLPTAKALQQFLSLERFGVPLYSSLWNYRFMIGHCEQLPFSVQLGIEENFLKLEKCVKYMNGEGYTNETVELIRDAKALYLRRHWTAEKLSVFDIRRLKYCLLMECNELQTLVDQGDLYKHKNRLTSHNEGEILGSLQYLSIHFMKKLQRISKGRIGRNSLSSLRILALHTCPNLTSIFTGCLLDNMHSLTELIVEDCPKVKCLVDLGEVTPWSNGPFLLSLRRVSLIDLPELVSISGSVSIAPQLDTLLVFNCMKLNYLSVMEIPRGTKAIKGEIEWWDALNYGKLAWDNVFVQLKRDGGLMDQLAEDTNSLKHFVDLEMSPSHHGSSSHVGQNSSTDHHLWCNYVSTKEDLEHVDSLHIGLPSSNEIHKTGDTDCDMKAVNHQLAFVEKKSNNIDIDKWIQQVKRDSQIGDQLPPDCGYICRKYLQNGTHNSRKHRRISSVTSKHRVKVSKGIEVEKALQDGYTWSKYGQKATLGSKYPRSYYRCNFRTTGSCTARKHVQRSTEDPSVFEVCYRGVHTCSTILRNNFSSTETVAACKTLTRGSPTATESASIITDNHFEVPEWPQFVDTDKKKSIKWTESDVPPDDGYVWRKYAKHEILSGKNSKSYYRCTSCNAEKQVVRSDDDPSIWEISYHGMHTCLRLSLPSDSTGATASALSIRKNSDCLTTSGSASDITRISVSSTTAESTCLRLSLPSDSTGATASALSIRENSDCLTTSGSASDITRISVSSTTAESTSTITDNSFGLDFTKKMNGSATIQRWKQQVNEVEPIFSPSIQLPVPSSSISSKPNIIISEIAENSSRNLPSPTKTAQNAKHIPLSVSKERKTGLKDKITELHQLVSPFGKCATSSILKETCDYIKFLHDQISALVTPHTKQGGPVDLQQQTREQDLTSQGLCLVPVSSAFQVTNPITDNVYAKHPDGPKL